MSFPAASTSEAALNLRSIENMSEEELKQFVLEHCTLNENCPLSTHEWQTLSDLHQRTLIEKFRQVADSLRKQPPAGDSSLDLNRLETFLQDLALDANLLVPFPPTFAINRKEERAYHDRLVKDGGRPAYNIEHMEQVISHEERYYQLVLPWKCVKDTDWTDRGGHEDLFQVQYSQWYAFRMWQRFNRSDDDVIEHRGEENTVPYTYKRSWRPEAAPDHFGYKSWEAFYRAKSWQVFDSYVEAVKQKLASHSVDHALLSFDADPRKQDKLTTWLEYLSFQYFHIQWEEQWMEMHREDAENILLLIQDEMGHNSVDPANEEELQTVEELRSLMNSAWYVAECIEASERNIVAGRQFSRLRSAVDRYYAEGIKTPAELYSKFIDADNNARRVKLQTKRVRVALNQIEHCESDPCHPFFTAAEDAYLYEKLSLWVRDQIPIIQEEMKAEAASPKGRKRPAPAEEADSPAPRRCPRPMTLVDNEPAAAATVHGPGDDAAQAVQPEEGAATLVEQDNNDGPPAPKKRKRRFLPSPDKDLRRSERIANRLEKQAREAEAALVASQAKAREEAKAKEEAKKPKGRSAAKKRPEKTKVTPASKGRAALAKSARKSKSAAKPEK